MSSSSSSSKPEQTLLALGTALVAAVAAAAAIGAYQTKPKPPTGAVATGNVAVFVPEVAPGRAIVDTPTIPNFPTKQAALAYFDQLDDNGNNVLSSSELGDAWKMFLKNQTYKASVTKAYKAADFRSLNGSIVRSEFEAFLRYIFYHDYFYEQFHTVGSKNNTMTRENFYTVAPKLGVNDANKAFDLMDANASGKVTYEEFCSWMAQNTCQWKM